MTLKEAYDRILATKVTARWAHASTGTDTVTGTGTESRVEAFAETYGYSLQQTLYAMANRALDNRRQIDEVRLSLPNSHHFLVDLEPFRLTNDNQVYYAADRPYGMIEGTVHRPGTVPAIPVDEPAGSDLNGERIAFRWDRSRPAR